MIASAPGKLIALGEYAVLDPSHGADAVVLAIDRRATAFEVDADADADPPGPFLARAEELVREIAPPGARPIRVDTSAFRGAAGKLGLGSSAAATVAYVAARLARAGVGHDRALIHRLAHRAHAEAQAASGAPGSGVDIAASVHGGTLAVNIRGGFPQVVALDPGALRLVAVYSGEPASTTMLVSAVGSFAAAAPDEYSSAIAAIAAASSAGIDALVADDARGFIAAIEAGYDALEELGRRSGIELITERHRSIASLARAARGAAKPTGAGGGDTAAAFFASEADARRFRGDLMASGIEALDAAIDSEGVVISQTG